MRLMNALHFSSVAFNSILVIWATALIGTTLPNGHKYEDGWIFGLAWFPILLFLTIEIVTINKLPKRILPAIIGIALPFIFVLINLALGKNVTLANFVVQTAMLQFTAHMLSFALQAAVFPILFKTIRGTIASFIQEEALPQLFGAFIGLGLSWLALDFLLTYNVLTTRDLPLILAGVLQSGITTGLALHRNRTI